MYDFLFDAVYTGTTDYTMTLEYVIVLIVICRRRTTRGC